MNDMWTRETICSTSFFFKNTLYQINVLFDVRFEPVAGMKKKLVTLFFACYNLAIFVFFFFSPAYRQIHGVVQFKDTAPQAIHTWKLTGAM